MGVHCPVWRANASGQRGDRGLQVRTRSAHKSRLLANVPHSYHVGETELGSSFGQAYAKYEEEIATPFADFVHLISSKSPRLYLAIVLIIT